MPLSLLLSSQHFYLLQPRLRLPSTAAARCLAIGPVACLPANQSGAPHTDLSDGLPLDPSLAGQPHLHPVSARHVETGRAAIVPDARTTPFPSAPLRSPIPLG